MCSELFKIVRGCHKKAEISNCAVGRPGMFRLVRGLKQTLETGQWPEQDFDI